MKSLPGKATTDILILSLAIINIAVHLLVIKNLEYHRDELLYFSGRSQKPVA